MKPLRTRIEALEARRKMTEAELEVEFARLSRLYRDDPGMEAVIDRVSSDTPESTLAAAILAARKRANMGGSK